METKVRMVNPGEVSGGSNGKNPALLPPDYNELYVVITEGRPDLINLAQHLRRRLAEVTPNGKGTVLMTNTAYNALRISRDYGHVPLVLMIGDKSDTGKAYPVHAFVSGAYEKMADVHHAFTLKAENAYEVVAELNDEKRLNSAVDTILWERAQNVLPARQRTQERILRLDELVTAIENQFDSTLSRYSGSIHAPGIQTRIVKMGGSMYDLIETKEGAAIFQNTVKSLADLVKTKEYNIMLTVGGGPFYDPAKQARENLQMSSGQEKSMARASFRQQASTLVDMLLSMGVPARRVEDTALLQAVESIVKSGSPLPYVPVVLSIPAGYPGARFTVAPERSDELAVALADLVEEPSVIFLKDTAAIYLRDPNLKGRQVRALPEQFQNSPPTPLIRIYNDAVLAGEISRVGPDGRDQHLVENSALETMQQTMRVGSIRVVNGRDAEAFIKAMTMTQPVGSYILNQNVSPASST